MKLLTRAFLGVGGVAVGVKFFWESLRFAGDLRLSLELILTVVLGLFGSEEKMDFLGVFGVFWADDKAARTMSDLGSALTASAILLGAPDISSFMRLEDFEVPIPGPA